MKKHLLMITTAASILACGTLAASAQDDSTPQTCSSWSKRSMTLSTKANPVEVATE